MRQFQNKNVQNRPEARGTAARPVARTSEKRNIRLCHRGADPGLFTSSMNKARTATTMRILQRYADGLREGMRVSRGQLIGHVGSTGDASPAAPHLHFAIYVLGPERRWWKGTAIDPYSILELSLIA